LRDFNFLLHFPESRLKAKMWALTQHNVAITAALSSLRMQYNTLVDEAASARAAAAASRTELAELHFKHEALKADFERIPHTEELSLEPSSLEICRRESMDADAVLGVFEADLGEAFAEFHNITSDEMNEHISSSCERGIVLPSDVPSLTDTSDIILDDDVSFEEGVDFGLSRNVHSQPLSLLPDTLDTDFASLISDQQSGTVRKPRRAIGTSDRRYSGKYGRSASTTEKPTSNSTPPPPDASLDWSVLEAALASLRRKLAVVHEQQLAAQRATSEATLSSVRKEHLALVSELIRSHSAALDEVVTTAIERRVQIQNRKRGSIRRRNSRRRSVGEKSNGNLSSDGSESGYLYSTEEELFDEGVEPSWLSIISANE
jgi:hypothetical protein